ncbi:hypothetical protein C0992_005684 [Termitomyces sp. T32_za158]|nr:hypothetical protein C0992_005684 [Termitomyces sp. T32_za158]
MSETVLPVLLPKGCIPQESGVPHLEWKPSKYRSAPQPPPQDDGKLQELELASARQMLDGKLIKKTRPRRTVDYNGGMGRWALHTRITPQHPYAPSLSILQQTRFDVPST